MEFSKCKACGQRHALGHCPKAYKANVQAPKRILPTDRCAVGYLTGSPASDSAPPPKKTRKVKAPADKFDKVSYQRDYMRRQRAKGRVSKSGAA